MTYNDIPKEVRIFDENTSLRLDVYLSQHFPDISRSKWKYYIQEGLVSVNHKNTSVSYMLRNGDEIFIEELPTYQLQNLTPVPMDLDIIYEDSALLIINKPRNLVVHPSASTKEPTLVHGLLAHSTSLSQGSAIYRPGIVHRLDKDTTGLLVVAKTDQAHQMLAKQIEERTLERTYLTWVHGNPVHEKFIVEANIGRDINDPTKMSIHAKGKFARTHFQVLKKEMYRSLLMAKLDTGRTHQIRVHLQSVGHSVIGDPTYLPLKSNPELFPKYSYKIPLQLHAVFLKLIHPISHKTIEFSAEIPEDFIKFDNNILKNI